MTANELFSKMEGRFGKYQDCGVVCSNGEDIRSVFCEIDWYMLYNVMIDRNALYVVHHPVSDFALRLSEINPEEKEDDIRSEAQNWLLEFKARELQMNLAVAHTMADKMLEAELSDCLEGAKGAADRHTHKRFLRSILQSPSCDGHSPRRPATARSGRCCAGRARQLWL